MVTVNVHVDTNSNAHQGGNAEAQNLIGSLADKIGLVSSVPLDADMIKGFQDGVALGEQDYEFGGEAASKEYQQNLIIGKKNDHKTRGCKVIATVGGSIAFDAINTNNDRDVRFVSLVGNIPTTGL